MNTWIESIFSVVFAICRPHVAAVCISHCALQCTHYRLSGKYPILQLGMTRARRYITSNSLTTNVSMMCEKMEPILLQVNPVEGKRERYVERVHAAVTKKTTLPCIVWGN